MSTTWPIAKEAVRQAVAACLELPDYLGADGTTTVRQVSWQRQTAAQRWVGNLWADLILATVTAHGDDEDRYLEPASPFASADTARCGVRHFSVSVRVCAYSQEDTEETVGIVGERIRLRWRMPEPRALWQAAGVATVEIGPTFETDYIDQNGRAVSCAITELRLALTVSETTPEFAIECIEVEGQVT